MSHSHGSSGGKFLGIVIRFWSLGIIALVAYLSFLAIQYLVVTLMFPTETPDEITGVPLRLTRQVLDTRRDAWGGLTAVEFARSPIAHYHRIDGWIQPDPVNSCTQSGCHSPLPHARRKEVRAFLNMHTTSMHCGVCHMTSPTDQRAMTWYSLTDGSPCDEPIVLQTYAWLMSEEGQAARREPTLEFQQRLVRQLYQAAADADQDPVLVGLADQLSAVRFDSPAFAQMIESLPRVLPRQFRGEYNMKLALKDAQGQPRLTHPDSTAAINRILAAGESLQDSEREQLIESVHTARRSAPLQCGECHVREGGVFDFAAAGYPPERIHTLTQPMIFRMISNISSGQPFYMPSFIGESENTTE
jgi:hypothetical protein